MSIRSLTSWRLAMGVTGLLLIPVFFWNLDAFPLRLWDESRLAVNALEMVRDGDWLVTHFDGRPDLWNTKPPLLIWGQAAAIRVIGPGDLAVRLPSAVAGWLTALLLVAVSRIHLGKAWFGVVAALILAAAPGFTGLHGARTADYDAPLTLWTTLYCLAFFLFLHTGRLRYLYTFWTALILAVLTKGVGGVLFLPALGLFSLFRGQLPALLRNRHTYFGFLALVALVAGYYGLREAAGPGYLAEVVDNELGGRYLRSIEGHGESPFFFLQGFRHGRLGPWTLLVPLGLAAGFVHRSSPLAALTRFSSLLAVSYVLIISLSRTKCRWYDVPIYPFLAILVAAFLWVAVRALVSRSPLSKRPVGPLLVPLLLGLVCLYGYAGALREAHAPEDNYGFYQLGHTLKAGLAGQVDLEGTFVLLKDYSPQNRFYLDILRDKGCDIQPRDLDQLGPGDRVLVQDGDLVNRLTDTFTYRSHPGWGPMVFYQIVDD